MSAFRFARPSGPHLLAAFGGLSLLAGLGLAASRPARSAGGPIAVTVANTPLPTTTADDHDKQGVQFTADLFIAAGSTRDIEFPYLVPHGKRLVIETISSSTNSVGDPDHYSITTITAGGLGSVNAFSFFNELPDGSPYSVGTAHPHLYAEAGDKVLCELDRTETAGDSTVSVTFTGYLVDIATPGGPS